MQINKVLLGVGIAFSIIMAISNVCSAKGGKVLSLLVEDQDRRQQSKDDDIQQESKGQEEEEGSLLPFLVRRKRGKLSFCSL
jgi:hypothetical protein